MVIFHVAITVIIIIDDCCFKTGLRRVIITVAVMTMMRMMMMRMMAVVLAAAVVTMLRSFMTIGSTARMTKTHPECAWTSKAHSACTKRAVWEPSCFPKSAEPSPVDPV